MPILGNEPVTTVPFNEENNENKINNGKCLVLHITKIALNLLQIA